jgi:hypothetical protein
MAYELSCSYKWNDEIRHFFLEIKKDKVISKSSTHQIIIEEDIIQEINNHLYFGQTVILGETSGYRLHILDKETLKFREMVLHDPKIEVESSAVIQGVCFKVN